MPEQHLIILAEAGGQPVEAADLGRIIEPHLTRSEDLQEAISIGGIKIIGTWRGRLGMGASYKVLPLVAALRATDALKAARAQLVVRDGAPLSGPALPGGVMELISAAVKRSMLPAARA